MAEPRNNQPRAIAPDDFYVGYLPVPQSHRKFLRIAVPAALWLLAAIAALVASMQRDPGDAIWHESTEIFTGRLVADPYARLIVSEPDGTNSSIFIVEFGKLGGGARAEPLAGQFVQARGTLLERDGRRILELLPGIAAIKSIDTESAPPTDPQQLGSHTLVGEIVDFKCYLGAMKPGDGKTHRVCATLCVRGGIPPALVTTDPSGAHAYHLLVDPNGQPLNTAVLPFIAEPVRINGTLEANAGALFLRTTIDDIERLR